MVLPLASVHDLQCPNGINISDLNNCTHISNGGYLSAEYQTDLFQTQKIKRKKHPYEVSKKILGFSPSFKKLKK